MTARCSASRWSGAAGTVLSHPAGSSTTAPAAASACWRKVAGSACTSLRSAARTSGVAPDGPAMRKQRPGLVGRQAAQVGAGAPDQLPPAATAGLGVDGDAGQGEALEVPAGRALADLELLGQLGGGDPALGLQDQEGGHEAVGAHVASLSGKVAKGWPLSGRTMALTTQCVPGVARPERR